MSAAATSSPIASARRMTDVIGRAHALQIDVCRAGTMVALHLATAGGVIVITADYEVFARGCRGPRDHNRHPFPAAVIDDIEAEALPSSCVRRPRRNKPNNYGQRGTPPEKVEQYRQVWRRFIADPAMTVNAAAAEMGLHYSTACNWFKRFRNEPGAPAVKPNGKL